ncbi:hypothetical protein FRX31_004514 [Thalictrum thalictroides]|uniref:Uncharacterized protein n=1 Tax=Thalictrum thalictroides TaxID=46969 RepID=A0A7J6XBZ5_THATH|nr:hypothetical protein FRX31_004514 [Thalictrum thalictroides]
MEYIYYNISEGTNTLLWHEPWCFKGLIWENNQARQLLDFPTDAKVSVLMTNDQWNENVYNLSNSQLQRQILGTEINYQLEADRVIWEPSSTGIYLTRSAYIALRKIKQK